MNYGFCAALAYTSIATIFMKRANFEDAWLLNVGNVAFMVVVSAYAWRNRLKISNGINKVIAGVLVTVTGILICYLLLLAINLLIAVPVLKDAPANNVLDKKKGLLLMVAINAGIVNFSCGSFISLMIAYAVQSFRKK